ncbi:hypothetical protein L6R29_05860 [Myxococcota bacterium]|nr:hypothetical protein [Myxococcota bacterium]
MNCVSCGSHLEQGVVFCKVCGKYNAHNKHPQSIGSSTAPSPSAPRPAAPPTPYPGGPQPTSQYPGIPQQTGQYPGVPQQTGQYPGVPQQTGQYPGVPQQTGQYPGVPQQTGTHQGFPQQTGTHQPPPYTPQPSYPSAGQPYNPYGPPSSSAQQVNRPASSQMHRVVEPFGEVNVHVGPHAKQIIATLLTYQVQEGTKTGLALDGSLSMKKVYGQGGGKGTFFGGAQTNEVQPIAQLMCRFLAEEVDCRGQTTALYWACGPMGAEIELLGDISVSAANQSVFGGPTSFGRGTRLMPPLRYFAEASKDAAFGMYVFVTDGAIDDLEEVKAFTTELAQTIEAGKRPPFKGVLIGLGPEVKEEQMIELDDLETGTEVDIWDHKLAGDLRQMWDIFAEVVSRNEILAPWGRILDQDLRLLKEYPNGLPTLLEFEVPLTTTHIILEAAGQRAEPQPLF